MTTDEAVPGWIPGPFLDVVFDGPPSHTASRLVDCEDTAGCSVKAGVWVDRNDGTWALRLTHDDIPAQETPTRPPGRVRAGFARNHPHCTGADVYTSSGELLFIECCSPGEHR